VGEILREADEDFTAVMNSHPLPLPEPRDIVCLRYRIEERLDGDEGAVFGAKNLGTGDSVAIEVHEPAADELVLARQLADARAISKIEHPHVLPIHDVREERGRAYLVTGRDRGESLRERLAGGPMPVEQAIQTVLAVARGVAEGHRVGVVHGNPKPSDILVVDGEPKVKGFGLGGDHAYMAPEQLAGQPADALSDVYAMGVLLYECLAGVRPYRTEELLPLMTEISAGRPAPIRSFAPAVPPALEALALRAMSPDRAARPPSMDAWVRALETLELEPATTIHMRPISAPPMPMQPITAPPPSYAPAPAPQRSPWLLAVASFVIFSTIGVAGLALAAGTWALVSGAF